MASAMRRLVAVLSADVAGFEHLSGDQLLKLAIILHEVYGSYDLALLSLEVCEKMGAEKISDAYKARLTAASESWIDRIKGEPRRQSSQTAIRSRPWAIRPGPCVPRPPGACPERPEAASIPARPTS